MPEPISALEHEPFDLVREVSPDAISFYVDELSGIYLPEEFKVGRADVLAVKRWKPENRLNGKFGRFTVTLVVEKGEEENEERLDDILVMGTSIGLSGIDRYRSMDSLRHYTLDDMIGSILKGRDIAGPNISVRRADYGSTIIGPASNPGEEIIVGSSSYDFGRASTDGRQETCDLFAQLLGDKTRVVNSDPEPREKDKIITSS
jgi:hypothetical protein